MRTLLLVGLLATSLHAHAAPPPLFAVRSPIDAARVRRLMAEHAGAIAHTSRDAGEGPRCRGRSIDPNILSWSCRNDSFDDVHEAAMAAENGTWRLAPHALVVLRLRDFVGAAPRRLASAIPPIGDTPADPDDTIVGYDTSSLELWDPGNPGMTYRVARESLEGLLVPGNPWSTAVERDPDVEPTTRELLVATRRARASLTEAEQRFVARGEVLYDRATGLEWTTRDNGADVDHAGAEAWVEARGFRLPSVAELELLSDPAELHETPGDCTHGKVSYVLSPRVAISCGLVWASDSKGDAAGAFGFVSGRAQWKPRTTTKNLRALGVREGRFEARDAGLYDRETRLTWRRGKSAKTAAAAQAAAAPGRLPTRVELETLGFLVRMRAHGSSDDPLARLMPLTAWVSDEPAAIRSDPSVSSGWGQADDDAGPRATNTVLSVR